VSMLVFTVMSMSCLNILIFVECIDGTPLLLNEIEKDLPACSSKVLLETKWTFITQEVHFFLLFSSQLSVCNCFLIFSNFVYLLNCNKTIR